MFFANDVILNEFKASSHFSKYNGPKTEVLTEKNDNKEKTSKVSSATNQGQVTLCTREFGRGTDFKYQGNLVINAGGLHVIQTFFTNDYSEEIQIRGRTRRQGTTGSYELAVLLEDLQQIMGQEFVDDLLLKVTDPNLRYKALHTKRKEIFKKKQNDKLAERNKLLPTHNAYANHVENIKRFIERKPVTEEQKSKFNDMLFDINKSLNYNIPREKMIKALVLIDATKSMGNLLENAKNTIALYFETVCENLTASKYEPSIFKLQMAFYRNYSSGSLIL